MYVVLSRYLEKFMAIKAVCTFIINFINTMHVIVVGNTQTRCSFQFSRIKFAFIVCKFSDIELFLRCD